MLVFEKNKISYNTPINRVILAALREIENLKYLVDIPSKDISIARGLAMLFADCRDAEILFARRVSFIDQVQNLIGTTKFRTNRMISLY